MLNEYIEMWDLYSDHEKEMCEEAQIQATKPCLEISDQKHLIYDLYRKTLVSDGDNGQTKYWEKLVEMIKYVAFQKTDRALEDRVK